MPDTTEKVRIRKGDASRRRPSDTTGHTGPYHGGSVKLNARARIQARKSQCIEITVGKGNPYPGRLTDTPRALGTPSRRVRQVGSNPQTDQLRLAPSVDLPLFPLHATQTMTDPTIEITQN